MLPLGCVCCCALGAAPVRRAARPRSAHYGWGRRPVCSLTASVDLTAFERCDRRHKLLFEYPIIFWTPRGSLNHSGTGARPVASSRQPLARPLCLHAPGPSHYRGDRVPSAGFWVPSGFQPCVEDRQDTLTIRPRPLWRGDGGYAPDPISQTEKSEQKKTE
jgi:hypothetical protein